MCVYNSRVLEKILENYIKTVWEERKINISKIDTSIVAESISIPKFSSSYVNFIIITD